MIKTIALIAHDSKKSEIVNWCIENKTVLEKFELCGTGTTAKKIQEAKPLPCPSCEFFDTMTIFLRK